MLNKQITTIFLNIVAVFPCYKKSSIAKTLRTYKSFYGVINVNLIPDVIQNCLDSCLISVSNNGLFHIEKSGIELIRKNNIGPDPKVIAIYHSIFTNPGISLEGLKDLLSLSPGCSDVDHGSWTLQDEIELIYVSNQMIASRGGKYEVTQLGVLDYQQKLFWTA